MNRYKLEELIPIVAQLTEKYTSKESSSITYQKAQQLMQAVLYCIQEIDRTQRIDESEQLVSGKLEAKVAYETGYNMVLEKVKSSRILFEEISEDFCAYGNICYYETVVKGMPAFFMHYDIKFNPQNHILTLDYPTIQNVYDLIGVDAIYVYLSYIKLEQRFLKAIPENVVIELLTQYHKAHEDLIINIPSIVLKYILGRMIIGKHNLKLNMDKSDYEMIKSFVLSVKQNELCLKIEQLIDILIQKNYDGDLALFEYLKGIAKDFSFELINAVENNCLEVLLLG